MFPGRLDGETVDIDHLIAPLTVRGGQSATVKRDAAPGPRLPRRRRASLKAARQKIVLGLAQQRGRQRLAGLQLRQADVRSAGTASLPVGVTAPTVTCGPAATVSVTSTLTAARSAPPALDHGRVEMPVHPQRS